jgi:hypothetical protein
MQLIQCDRRSQQNQDEHALCRSRDATAPPGPAGTGGSVRIRLSWACAERPEIRQHPARCDCSKPNTCPCSSCNVTADCSRIGTSMQFAARAARPPPTSSTCCRRSHHGAHPAGCICSKQSKSPCLSCNVTVTALCPPQQAVGTCSGWPDSGQHRPARLGAGPTPQLGPGGARALSRGERAGRAGCLAVRAVEAGGRAWLWGVGAAAAAAVAGAAAAAAATAAASIAALKNRGGLGKVRIKKRNGVASLLEPANAHHSHGVQQ